MLVSKNPDVTEPRQNLTSQSPHLALKTGEKFPRNLRLKSLIFIVEKYRKKLLFKQKSRLSIETPKQRRPYGGLVLTASLIAFVYRIRDWTCSIILSAPSKI